MAIFRYKLSPTVEREGDPEDWPIDFDVLAEIAWQGDGDSPEVEDIDEVTFWEADGREVTLTPAEMKARFGEEHYAELVKQTRRSIVYADDQALASAWEEALQPDYD